MNLNGALIQTGGDAAIAAARDLNLGTTALIATRDVQTRDALNGSHDAVTQNLGSAILAGGSLATVSGRDTTLTHATVSANGDATLIAGGNLTVTAAKDTQTHSEQSMGGKQAQHIGSSYDEAAQGTFVGAGGNVTLAAGQNGSGNLAILGSTVTADTGGVRLVSTGDVTIGSVSETHDAQSWSHNQHSGFLSKEATNDAASSHQVISNGSTVSGDTVTGAAGHDMTISGSTIAATHDVTLAAVNNLTINTTQDTSESSTFHEEKKSGFGALSGGGMTLSYGNSDQKDAAHDASVANNASLIGSTNGSVNLAAGNDLHVTGSDLIAAQNITGTGANVIIDAASGATHHDETHERKQSGFTVGLAGSVGDALNNAVSQSEGVRRDSGSGDSRAAALHGIAAASDAYTVGNAAVGAATGKGVPDIGVQVSFGSAKSRSGFSEDQTRNSGSNVQAGGTAVFVATGNGTPGSGNLTIAGSNVSANDVVLAAKDKLNIVNTTDTDATRSSNGVSSASVGVSLTTVGGAGISASMQNAHGDANSDAATQNASHVTGANSVTVVSGGDTNIIGSQVNGRQITAEVGGDLNVVSVQDKTTSAAHRSSTGGGFAINQHGGGASFSAQNGHGDANYAGVNEQAGLYAGDGGFNINVHGNTDLKGAVIASGAEASKNSLTTGTLSYSDIANRSSYDAKSGGFSAGGSVGLPDKAVGPSSVADSGGITPSLSQHDSGSGSATTRSGESAGMINIADLDHQTQDIATLNRDASNANGTVAKTPDVNNLLDKQADMMSAASAAGQAVAQRIGDYADAQFKATGDPAWDESGSNRIALHVAGGGLIGGLGGGGIGSAAQGAAGAGIAAWSAGDLNRLANGTRDTLGGGDAALTAGNVLANVVAGTGGFLIGGTTGAFTAGNADLYNRSTGNGDGQGSTANSALGWIGDQLASAGRGAQNMASQFAGLVNANGAQGPYVSPDDLNGLGGNSKPLAASGSAVPVVVCVPPVCTIAVAPAPGTPGYVPSNATLNSGNSAGNDQQSANDGGSSVPGRAQSRIDVTNDGMEHINDRHLDPSVNASQFSIGESDLRSLLQDPNTISTPITREIPSADGSRYVREIDVGKTIGTDKYSNGQPTSVMTVLTDKYGNLVTAFPGKLK